MVASEAGKASPENGREREEEEEEIRGGWTEPAPLDG